MSHKSVAAVATLAFMAGLLASGYGVAPSQQLADVGAPLLAALDSSRTASGLSSLRADSAASFLVREQWNATLASRSPAPLRATRDYYQYRYIIESPGPAAAAALLLSDSSFVANLLDPTMTHVAVASSGNEFAVFLAKRLIQFEASEIGLLFDAMDNCTVALVSVGATSADSVSGAVYKNLDEALSSSPAPIRPPLTVPTADGRFEIQFTFAHGDSATYYIVYDVRQSGEWRHASIVEFRPSAFGLLH